MRSIAALLVVLVALSGGSAAAGPALLFDANKGTIIYEEDIDVLWHPASLTKLMTAYLVFEAIRDGKFSLKDNITCSATAHAQAPTKIGLPIGAEMSVELGLKALIVKSANDVAVMLGEKVAGGSLPQFINMMNAKAAALGMSQTYFVNPNGLPDDRQVTSARDMALLAQAIIRDFPEYDWLFKLESVTVGKRKMRTHNALLRSYEGADGMKTGFICSSGYNVVVSATRDGRRLVAVVLGGRTGSERNVRAAELLDHGFRRFRWRSLFADRISERAIKVSVGGAPHDMAASVCGRRRAGPARKGKSAKKK